MTTRARATALIDLIEGGSGPDVQSHLARASTFVECFQGEAQRLGAWGLIRLLRTAVIGTAEPKKALMAAAKLAKAARVPIDGLSWALADPGTASGQLDMRTYRGRGEDVTAIGAVFSWWRHVGRGTLLLSGDTGSGKTVAAVVAAVHNGGRYIPAAEFGEIALGQGKALKAIAREPLLIIDELGRESDIGPTRSRVTEALRDRHDQGLGTIVTTQLRRVDRDDPSLSFEHRYGHHLLNRVDAVGKWVGLRQGSRRDGSRPALDGITKSCRIADLLPKVEAATGAAGGRPEDVHELQRLLGISDEDLDRAEAARESWRRPLLERAAEVGGVAGQVLRSMLAGEPAPVRGEVVDG